MIDDREHLESRLSAALNQYRAGKWRAPLFADLIMEDVRAAGPHARVVDIGCGDGFDGSLAIQSRICSASSFSTGIEPDLDIALPTCFNEAFRCTFEDAAISGASIDVAYSVFVMEHVMDPAAFWGKLQHSLKPGGVFWGFTADSRHYFAWASALLKVLRLKDCYLRMVQGADHYNNYQTFYKTNSPGAIRDFANHFSQIDCWSWSRVGQLDAYVPSFLHPISHAADRVEITWGLPGSILLVRAVH